SSRSSSIATSSGFIRTASTVLLPLAMRSFSPEAGPGPHTVRERLSRSHRAIKGRLPPLPGDREQVPAPGHALQGMFAALLESQVGADGEVLHGSRDKDFARLSEGAHPSTDVHCHSGDVAVLELALPRVQSGTQLNAERLDAVANRARALDRTGWAIEGREEPVPEGLHLRAAEALELASCDLVVARSNLAPPPT